MATKTSTQPLVNKHLDVSRRRLADGQFTTLYICRYSRRDYQVKLVYFEKATVLSDWCRQNSIGEAFSGGFFDRHNSRPLGELFLDGRQLKTTAIEGNFGRSRGSLLVTKAGTIGMAPRHVLPARPQAGLLQAGPLLVMAGQDLIAGNHDPEGFSATAGQYDSDISQGRYPRAALAVNENWLWTIAADGYNPTSAGLTLAELSAFCLELGATEALNLDGGGSVSMVSGSKLINQPRSRGYKYPMCRPVHNAIILTKK